MTKFPSLKCPICGKTYKEVGTFGNHMRNEHPGTIPEGWSNLRYAYFVHTGRSRGKCRECGGETPWNETTGAYSKICGSEACKKTYRDRFMKAMRTRYGATTGALMEDPKFRERMLTGRRISGEYTFQDGGKVGYMGALEKAFLVMLDQFFRFPSSDIMSPSPNRYQYYYNNEHDQEHKGVHSYVPDFYIPSCNLEIELKSSNNQRPSNLMIDVPRDADKDIAMIRNPIVNFCKIYEDDYYVFFQIFADLAQQHQTGEQRLIKYISRALLTSIYREYIPDECLKILDMYIYKYSDKSVMSKRKKKPATESDVSIDDPDILPILQEIIDRDDIDEETDDNFKIEDVYVHPDPPAPDENSEEEDDFSSGSVGVNPMVFYKLGDYADPVPNPGQESYTIFDSELVGAAMEGFWDSVDDSKIDGRAAKEFARWRDALFGKALVGDAAAKTFTKVTVEKGNIVIKGINCNLLLYRIKEKYSETKLKYIFEYQYNARSYKAYMKKKISKGDMKIDYVYAPVFFCLELIDLFNELANAYRDKSYKRIAELIYEASWLSKADKVTMPELSTEPLNNLRLTLMDHQIAFIKAWPQLKNQLNLNGYVLAFKPGKGKTLTAVGLAECLKADKVYIVCPNNLKDNWALEIKKYYAKYDDEALWMRDVCILGTRYGDPKTARFIITNNENIKLMLPIVKRDENAMFILDECHNFRNFNGGRSKELFELCDKIGSHNVLCVSATPIKAAPAELTPVLRIIDPTFTDEAAAMYARCFDLSNTMAMSLVNKRFGMTIYRPADVVVDLPPKTVSNLEYVVSDESRYYMEVVHGEIITDFKKRHDEWLKGVQPEIKTFQDQILKYAIADHRMTRGYLDWVITSSNSLRGGDNTDFHEVAIQEYKDFISTSIRTNPKCPPNVADSLENAQNIFITAAKRDMGKAIGSILPKRRNEMFIKLYEENKQDIYERIRNRGKKTIIFSTMVPVIKYIAADLNDFGIGTVSITGETKNRLEVITRFREDPNVLVLVATSWCMGVGVTLTEASQMFFFGTPWRSTDFEQASDRIYRIGQTDPVNIWTVKMKSKKHNLSDRMQDILDWSGRMFDTAITAAEFGEEDASLTPATESRDAASMIYTLLNLNHMLNGFGYGIIKNGVYVENPSDEDVGKYYTTISPGLFGKYHGGISIDYVIYMDYYLRARSIWGESYILKLPELGTTHCFYLAEDGDRWIYMESFIKKIAGVYVARAVDDVVSFIINNIRGNKTVTKIELIKIPTFYGKFGESAKDYFAKVNREGTKERVHYDKNIYMLNAIESMEDAIESFNMNLDSNQYEIVKSEIDMKQLNHINEIYNILCDVEVFHAGSIVEGEYPLRNYDSLMLSNTPYRLIGHHWNIWETVAYIYEQAKEYEPFGIMIDTAIRHGSSIVRVPHPVIYIPFRDGALYIERALTEKRNGFFYTEDINDAMSFTANCDAEIVLDRNPCVNEIESLVSTEAYVIPSEMFSPGVMGVMTETDIIDGIRRNGKKISIKLNGAVRELHAVEVLNHGWSINRY